jgi:hypothetical protein
MRHWPRFARETLRCSSKNLVTALDKRTHEGQKKWCDVPANIQKHSGQ